MRHVVGVFRFSNLDFFDFLRTSGSFFFAVIVVSDFLTFVAGLLFFVARRGRTFSFCRDVFGGVFVASTEIGAVGFARIFAASVSIGIFSDVAVTIEDTIAFGYTVTGTIDYTITFGKSFW